jgi:hypothetical protein
LHVALVVSVPGFLVLGWWQLHRALSGNNLSWAYTFEWPFFAAYAVWMWWKLVHEEPALPAPGAPGATDQGEVANSARARRTGQLSPGATTTGEALTASSQPFDFDPYDEAEPELAAYNRYLAGLHDAERPKQS